MILSTRRPAQSSAVVSLAAAIALVGCGDADPGGGDGASAVVATTSIWADVTSAVLCGQDVPALIPAGADPHSFEPSLRDRELLDRAGTVVINGAGLEGDLADLIGLADHTVDVSAHVDLIADDPHLWQDPLLVAQAASAIAADIARNGDETCDEDYVLELERLDQDIAELLAPIPADGRVMVTSHDSLAYFADRYDIEIVGTVIPSTNTLAETSAADLAALADLIDERGVRAIFTERLESSGDADALADRLGVQVVPLVTDALTDDPASDTYLEMMRSNAESIAQALAP